ncbi:MAG: hypothetical protein WCI05_05795 [Myxococcales bacterium]|jgi:hypothetical protein
MASSKSPNDTENTLQVLLQEVGAPDPTLLDALLQGTSTEALIEVGRTIRTARVVTDGVRIYGEAWSFWKGASAAQRAMLRGMSQRLLALAVHKLAELRALESEVGDGQVEAGTVRVTWAKKAELAAAHAVALRDQAFSALRDAAGPQSPLRNAVEAAFGTAEEPSNLARGLDAFATLLINWLGSDDEALKARLGLGNLDADYAKELQLAAKAVRDTAGAQRTQVTRKATQATLDLGDGINVLLLGQVLRAFEGAHSLEPTIPRLVPISTRRLFNHKKKGTPAAAPAAPKDNSKE